MAYQHSEIELGIERWLESEPFVWGFNDCCSAPANVLADAGFPDLRDYLRDLYHDKRSALALIDGAGGLEQLAWRLASRLGFHADDKNSPGAIAVIQAQHGPALAVGDGHRFYAKRLRGAAITGRALAIYQRG